MWWPHFQGTSDPYRWGHYTVSEYDPVLECRIPEQTSQMTDFEGGQILFVGVNQDSSWQITQ